MRKELGISSVSDKIREISILMRLTLLLVDRHIVVFRELLKHTIHGVSELRWIQIRTTLMKYLDFVSFIMLGNAIIPGHPGFWYHHAHLPS